MTIRAYLDHRVRRTRVVVYAGIALFVAGALLGGPLGQPVAMVATLPALAVIFAASMYTHIAGFRCMRCIGNLAPLAMSRGGLSLDPRVRYCPYCGVGLDEELPEAEEAGVDDRPEPDPFPR